MVMRRNILFFLGKAILFTSVQGVDSLSYSSPQTTRAESTSNHHEHNPLRVTYKKIDRKKVLSRDGNRFKLNRCSGDIEFGSTFGVAVTLESGDADMVSLWMSDARRVALSIWDENLLTDLGSSEYRLQLITLHLVTVKFAPSVNVKMWTEWEKQDSGAVGLNGSNPTSMKKVPVFKLQSVDTDPKEQIRSDNDLPEEALGIVIQIVGELRPSKDGRGIEGRLSFVTSGVLPKPMRLLPEAVLRASTKAVNRTVAAFAVRSFKKGTAASYSDFFRLHHAATDSSS